MRHPHPMVPLRGADASVPGVVLSPDAASGNPVTSSAGNGRREAPAPTLDQPTGSRVTFDLPEPPSANRYWRTHGHITYTTREGKAYVALVAGLTAHFRKDAAPLFPDGDVSVTVLWHRERKAGDLDNRSKVLYDALQGSIYTNDRQIAEDARKRSDLPSGAWSLIQDVFWDVPKGSVRVTVGAL